MNQQIWTKYKLENKQLHRWQLGDLTLQVSKVGKTISITKEMTEEAGDDYTHMVEDVPNNLEGGTHFISDRTQLFLMPAMPPMPVVFKPQYDLKIAAGIQSTVYFQVPIYVQVYLGSLKADNLLIEYPSVEMSQTWFGVPDNGELALSGVRDMFFTYQPQELKLNHIISPVKLYNASSSTLDFQRFLLRVPHLSIYAEKTYLCSNETKITFKGVDVTSDIQLIKSRPTFSDQLKLLAGPRSSDGKSLLKKSFHFFKSITQ